MKQHFYLVYHLMSFFSLINTLYSISFPPTLGPSLGSNIALSSQTFIEILQQAFFVFCVIFWSIQKYTTISLIQSYLIFPYDLIQVICHRSEYDMSNVVLLKVSYLEAHDAYLPFFGDVDFDYMVKV